MQLDLKSRRGLMQEESVVSREEGEKYMEGGEGRKNISACRKPLMCMVCLEETEGRRYAHRKLREGKLRLAQKTESGRKWDLVGT